MPKLRCGGASFYIAADELPLPFAAALILRLSCGAVVAVAAGSSDFAHACDDRDDELARSWIAAAIGILAASACLFVALIMTLSRGPVMEADDRVASARQLLLARVFLVLPLELAVAAWGLVLAWGPHHSLRCVNEPSSQAVAPVALRAVTTWFAVQLGLGVALAVALVRTKGPSYVLRCALRCFVNLDDEAAAFIASTARELSLHLNLSLGDAVAGVLLLWRAAKTAEGHRLMAADGGAGGDKGGGDTGGAERPSLAELEQLRRACWFSLGVYGWPLHAMRRTRASGHLLLCCAAAHVLCGPGCGGGCGCCCCCGCGGERLDSCGWPRDGVVASRGDNCCGGHGRALNASLRDLAAAVGPGSPVGPLRGRTGGNLEEGRRDSPVAVYARWVEGAFVAASAREHAWAVFVDPTYGASAASAASASGERGRLVGSRGSVVVAVRGTLSASDAIADLWCDEAPVPMTEVLAGSLAEPLAAGATSAAASAAAEVGHAGVVAAAGVVFRELAALGVLVDLLDRGVRPEACEVGGEGL